MNSETKQQQWNKHSLWVKNRIIFFLKSTKKTLWNFVPLSLCAFFQGDAIGGGERLSFVHPQTYLRNTRLLLMDCANRYS